MARYLLAVGFPLVFAAGWLSGARGSTPAPSSSSIAHEEGPAVPTVAAAGTASCVDPHAMQANANLVAQLRESKLRLASARETARLATKQAIDVESGPPASLVPPKDEWVRMGKEGMLRVRTPCAKWDGTGRLKVIQKNHRMSSSVRSGGMARARIEAAGFTAEETPAIEQAFLRVQKQTWRKIESLCNRNEGYHEWVTENPPETDAERIDMCRTFAVGAGPAMKPMVERVAELRAGHGSVAEGQADAERVLLVTTESTEALWNELSATFGREKARRAADSGIVCLDEVVYDVREPSPS